MEENKNITQAYLAAVKKRIETAQTSGDVANDFVYSFGDKTWLMTLPQSVMAQKRLLHLRDIMLKNPDDPDADENFIRDIARFVKMNGNPVQVDMLEYGELEVMKMAYMDALLLPLFLGGETSVRNYMQAAAGNLK